MTTISLILITSIIAVGAIPGEAVNVNSNTDIYYNARINKLSGTLSYQNLQTMIVPNYKGLDVWTMMQLQPKLHPLSALSPTKSTNTQPIAIQHEAGRRSRRQSMYKISGEDGGSSSIVPLTSPSSLLNVNRKDVYPMQIEDWIFRHLKFDKMNQIQKSTLKNRHTRSASNAEISEDKNITSTASPMIPNDERNMSAIKCLLSLSFPVSLPTQCIQFYFKSFF
ncbi:PREDICTED: uncharacterized protein LOC107169490 [Diuraphis noxia]|uniref:uncharacterized protein LOC107169490 n=1 Tax=Diuraphis noxia TaxID=143948 RepID=UPI00076395A0|nr:PREDICTED: uncharacterized protein LOC107169490 [Diuraphis noxia]